MSTNTYPVFFNSQFLDSSNGTIYTVPSTPTTVILQNLQLKLTNVTSATRVVTLYAVASGGSASTDNALAVTMSVPPFDYIMIPCPHVAAGGTIEGFCDTTSAVNIQAVGGKLHSP